MFNKIKVSFYKQEKVNKEHIQNNIYRSKYKIIRRLRIMYLLSRKKLKLCIIPMGLFYKKITYLLNKILDPIPVILPYYKISLFWDLVSISFTLINVFTIPFEIAFIDGERVNKHLTFVSTIALFINIFMVMNTAYYENGVLQKSRTKILVNFIQNHLIIELLALICLWNNPFGISFLRIFFLIKFFQFYEIVQKLTESFQISDKVFIIVHLITLSVEVILICHIFACLWYSIGIFQENLNIQPNWISSQNLFEVSITSKYVSTLYFTIITVSTTGYGDIVAKSDLEKVFISALALYACGVFAYIVTTFQNVYRDYIKKQEDFISSLTDLNRYLYSRDVNPNLQQMARKYLKYIYDQDYKKDTMPSETLNVLSKFLREEIIEEIFKKTINNIQFLKNFSPTFQKALATKMKEINYGPDEMILRANQYQIPSLYYIFKGEVEVSLDKGVFQNSQFNVSNGNQNFYIHKEKEVFGLYEFISQNHSPSINVKSLQVTTIHYLSLIDFIDILNQFSIDKEKYYQLKDKLNLNQNYTSSRIFCYSCKSSQHLIKDCPIFFYRPVKERVINQFIQRQEEQRKKIQRSNKKLILNALAFRNEIVEDCSFFRDENSQIGSLEDEEDKIGDNSLIDKNLLLQNLQNINDEQLKNFELTKKMASNEKIDLFNLTINDASSQNKSQRDGLKRDSITKDSVPEESLTSIKIQDKDFILRTQTSLSKSNQKLNPSSATSALNNPTSALNNPLYEDQQKNEEKYQIQFNGVDNQNINAEGTQQVRKRQSHRKSTKQEFTQKALQLSARTLKYWNSIDKKFESMASNMKELKFDQNEKLIQNNNNPNDFKKALTIGEVKSVLEQMQMVNAQKAIKNTFLPPDYLVTETIKSYRFYLVHNNISQVIRQFNQYLSKKSTIQKKYKLMISNSHRSQKN